ncbi:NAD-dependent epimerase/dehydratase family protein [Alkalihalobacillus pseudalcaliphilus]|uniref:NAD-dependent epimerase/dehydratase family protein n=1 Tax=Alkalihalobacillus pseudalcaliphilus TaxID=79884 RepID=UPI00064DA651|nr:NAD-dependent epimerase/dehydratase family protein [Alkalihalobacillus pseudalcaliphilus]KMK77323.1 UDP-glucose epimerase [Alkalihalobacillus pseudalcaliphilus]
MKIVITGAAGFIGSNLCQKLLENPTVEIIGLDAFVGPTSKNVKYANVQALLDHPRFTLIESNMLDVNWEPLLKGSEYIYHLAGIPGVRASWGADFHQYVLYNITATQRLLEACKSIPLKKFIFASTSSVYGEKSGQISEKSIPKPLSPYGITKLTGEHLCHVYRESFNIPTVILRYFTVFGPKQRSDMAFYRFIKSMIKDKAITIYGDGTQTRDFTYIDDCVIATASVRDAKNVIGETINIGGKQRSSLLNVISILEELLGKKAKKAFINEAIGEPKHTWADISKAEKLLNYQPLTDLKTGLKNEIDYIKKH